MLMMLRVSESTKIQDHLFKMYAGESLKEVMKILINISSITSITWSFFQVLFRFV